MKRLRDAILIGLGLTALLQSCGDGADGLDLQPPLCEDHGGWVEIDGEDVYVPRIECEP